MESMDSRRDHHTMAIDGEMEMELELGERNNAASIPPVVEQEAPGPMTGGRRPPGRARRLIRRLSPASVGRACKTWLKHPAHLALVAWALCVAASGTMLGLLLLGVLNGAFPRRSLRNRWIEINNQILNALFTLMSIYQHPALFHHAVLLLRWRQGDAKELRKAYCRKGASPRRRERLHMSVVVALLHLTCFAQYVMCGLYWGYSRKARPGAIETSLVVVGTATPVLAGLYMYFSQLGRKHEQSVHEDPDDREASDDDDGTVVVVVTDVAERAEVVASPEWAGGLLDVGDDPTAWWLSCLCTFCVFGWNMERLGLGNVHVHTVMFALLCFAPLWVLNVAAMNIRDEDVGDMVGAAGVVLCALGLLYGGFWRARMRRKFGLPGSNNKACCGSPTLADYLQWMFCWGCALAQEVRTGSLLLDVEAGGGASRRGSGSGQGQTDTALQPLPRENGVRSPCQAGSGFAIAEDTGTDSVPLANCSPCRGEESPLLKLKQEGSSSAGEMRPPVPPSMQERQRRQDDECNDR